MPYFNQKIKVCRGLASLLIVCFGISFNTGNSKSDISSTLSDDQLNILTSTYLDGKEIFSKHCVKCHGKPYSDKTDQYFFDRLFDRLPGPAENYLVKFTLDSKALRDSGDEYALQLKKVWSSSYEHMFKDSLSSKDLEKVGTYLKVACEYTNK